MSASIPSTFANISFNLKNNLFDKWDIKRWLQDIPERLKSHWQAKKSIFIDGHTSYSHINEKVDLILSPQFYWVRREKLPVKRVSQAMKIVESFFSDILPDGQYKYKVVKEEEYFLLFAYQDDAIMQALQTADIDMALVNKLFFLQTELIDHTIDAIAINDEEWLYNEEGIWIKLSKEVVDMMTTQEELRTKRIELVIRDMTTSKYHIPIDRYNMLIDEKSLRLIILALFALFILFMVQYFMMKEDRDRLIISANQVSQKYKMPQSKAQLGSILKSLEKKKTNNIASRELLQYLLAIPLQKGDYLKNLSVDNKQVAITIKIGSKEVEKSNAQLYKDYLQKRPDISLQNIKVKDLLMEIRGTMITSSHQGAKR